MQATDFIAHLQHILAEAQASDVVVLDVSNQTSITDYMIICSGRSSRQVKAISSQVYEYMKKLGLKALGKPLDQGDWNLLDYGDFVLHVMQPETRAFYNLEELWS